MTPTPRIDPDRLWRHATAFAAHPRPSGSQDEARAFAYAQAELDRLGYRTRLLHHPAFVSWPLEAHLELDGAAYPCITHAMAADRPDGVEAPLIDLTDVAPAAWTADDVAGRIACVGGLASAAPVRRLQALGAAGGVFVNDEHTHEMIVSRVWGSPDPWTVADLPSLPVASVDGATWARLRAAARAADGPARLRTRVDTRWRDLPLLEADLDAPSGRGDFVLLSGHVDAWHLGAMDNGAANAAMLEVAAQVAERRDTLRRGLRLAFWSGHSHGRYAGSAWYADERFEELRERCVLHVNIDCVGGQGADELSAAPAMAEAADLAARSIATVTDGPYAGARAERAGDQSFCGHGIPALFMGLSEQPKRAGGDTAADAIAQLFGSGRTGGYGWWWHTTEDTLDKVDPERLARDARVYATAVLEACGADVLPLRYAATVREIRDAVAHHLAGTGGLVDASRTLERLARLEGAVDALQRAIDAGDVEAAVANRAIKALGRALVPVNYVAGDPFEHDRAEKQPAVPSLAFAADLAGADEGARRRGAVALRRRLNRIDARLLEALGAAEGALVA